MNDSDFDKLFSDKLNEDRNFPNIDKNWDAVSAKLSAAQNAKMRHTLLYRAAVVTLLAGIFLYQWTAIHQLKKEIRVLKNSPLTTIHKYDTIVNTTVIYKTDTVITRTQSLEQIASAKKQKLNPVFESEKKSQTVGQKINSTSDFENENLGLKNISKNDFEKKFEKNISKNNLKENSEMTNPNIYVAGTEKKSEMANANISVESPEKKPYVINSNISHDITKTNRDALHNISTINLSPIVINQRRINLSDDGGTLKKLVPAIKIVYQRVFSNFSLGLRVGSDVLFDKHTQPPPMPGKPAGKDPNTMVNSNINYGVQLERTFGMHVRAHISADYSHLNFSTEAENPLLYVPSPQPIKDFDFHVAHGDMTGWFLGAGAQYSVFLRSHVRPFVSGGYAYRIITPFKIESEYHNKTKPDDTQVSSTFTTQHAENWYNIGLGVDATIYRNISARVSAEYWNTFGAGSDKKLLRLQGGVVVGF